MIVRNDFTSIVAVAKSLVLIGLFTAAGVQRPTIRVGGKRNQEVKKGWDES